MAGSNKEKGQSLVLVALASVVLVGMVALAIDGGYFFSQRRSVQNAADGGAVAGSFRLNQLRRSQRQDQDRLMTDIVRAVEAHGVPDTDGTLGNFVNANVQAFYLELNPNDGQFTRSTCQVRVCPSIPEHAWGIHVNVVKPTETFFAGIIGWNRANIGAAADSIIRTLETGAEENYWAVLGDNQLDCDNGAGAFKEVNLSGEEISIEGNVHSNEDFGYHGTDTSVSNGQVTYDLTCTDVLGVNHPCATVDSPNYPPAQRDPMAIVYPNYNTYRDLAHQDNNIIPRKTNGWDLDEDDTQWGDPDAPVIAWISGGDFVISGDDITLVGFFFVEDGNVRILGDNLEGSFTIVTNGTIDIAPEVEGFQGQPFVDYTGDYEEVLGEGKNVSLFYSTATQVASDVCTTPVISVRTDPATNAAPQLTGAILAPNGHIALTGENIRVSGAVVGNSIVASGDEIGIEYRGEYFPPQPNRVELVE